MMMTNVFAPMTAYAQAACAVSACSDNSFILPMDAIFLASIIILLVLTSPVVCRNMTSPFPCLPS